MSSFVEEKDRKIIPRWRTFNRTVANRELIAVAGPSPRSSADQTFPSKIADWQHNRTLPLASEVVGAAIVLGRDSEARYAAEFVLSRGTAASPVLRRLSEQILGGRSSDADTLSTDERPNASAIRKRLREYPNNTVGWVDLALHYTELGRINAARKAMVIATSLSPDDRFVLRSAARFFVHVDEPDRANCLLLRSQATQVDPWLIASEISVTSILGRASDLTKTGKRMISAGNYSDYQVSELTSALATQDLESGANRLARKLLRRSLNDPTENSVAQARWAFWKMGENDLEPSYLVQMKSFEAHAWNSFHEGQWNESYAASQKWLADQPFSAGPAIIGSYVAGVLLEDFVESARAARQGLVANPRDPMLLNNLAYALANLGRLNEARELLQRMKTGETPNTEILKLATTGLLEYRCGNVGAGRTLYLEAMRRAAATGNDKLRFRAGVFMAMEEKRARTAEWETFQSTAERSAHGSPDKDLLLLLRRLALR